MLDGSRKPIVILGPMESESALLISRLSDARVKKQCGYTFYEGCLFGYPAVICRCGIGVVNSAAAAALAVQSYEPLCVIIQGTSGAHDPDLHQGDIVLGEKIVELGSHYTKHRETGEGSDIFDWTQPGAEMLIDGELRRIGALRGDIRIINAACEVNYDLGRVVRGTIGAADIWNRELDVIAHLRRILGTDCEEMEGFGVAQVCLQAAVPCADIRIISNSEWHPDEGFDQKYGEYCQMFVLDVIGRIIADGTLM